MESEFAEDYQQLQESQVALEVEKKMAQNSFSAALELKEYNAIEKAKEHIIEINKRDRTNRVAAKSLIKKADNTAETNDKDYVFIHFILNNLPKGLIGLLLAVILSAAMSSTASELNALGTITALDLYKRNKKEDASEKHYVLASKFFTLAWGIVAILIANVANLFDNLIQLVNIIGSIFYGNVLGIFLLAFFVKYVKGNAVFMAAIITQVVVLIGFYQDWMSYLWLNAFGCALVVAIAIILESFGRQVGPKGITE
jgi:Na+/proline symporter